MWCHDPACQTAIPTYTPLMLPPPTSYYMCDRRPSKKKPQQEYNCSSVKYLLLIENIVYHRKTSINDSSPVQRVKCCYAGVGMQKTCVQTGNTTLPLWPAAGYQTLGFKHCSAQQASTTMNQVSFSLFNPPSPPGSSWPHLIPLSSILIPKMTRVTEVIKVGTPT